MIGEWNKIGDNFPPYDLSLILSNGEYVCIGFYSSKLKLFFQSVLEEVLENEFEPTHWMEMPKSPNTLELEDKICPICDGSGEYEVMHELFDIPILEKCYNCEGKGYYCDREMGNI